MKILAVISFLIPTFSFSQADRIDMANFNYDLLNENVATEINVIRGRKRLDSLTQDGILLSAAIDHAEYMGVNQKLTHNQRSKEKFAPYNRVVFYGGSHNLVNENALAITVGVMVEDSKNKMTYQKLAK